MTANRAYLAYIKLLSRNIKLKLYKTLNTTHTDLWVRNLDNNHGRNERAQNI
jgi:hypothetical protein